VRLCFIAYWLCARLANEWRAKGEKGEVQRLLRQLQAIRVGMYFPRKNGHVILGFVYCIMEGIG
jgi:hypothetical protein